MNAEANTPGTKPEASSAYVVLPNGKKRYVRATVVDVIFSALLPFWGLLIGLVALLRHENKRGLTMAVIGVVELALLFLLGGIG